MSGAGIVTRESGQRVFPGYRSGRLVVLGHQFRVSRPSGKYWMCVCACDCGNVRAVDVSPLATMASCGCLHRERCDQARGKGAGAQFVGYVPSPQEIEAACREIQQGWTLREKRFRAGGGALSIGDINDELCQGRKRRRQ